MKKDTAFVIDFTKIKLLNVEFYNLIQELKNNHLDETSEIGILAYNCFLEELASKLNSNKLN